MKLTGAAQVKSEVLTIYPEVSISGLACSNASGVTYIHTELADYQDYPPSPRLVHWAIRTALAVTPV